MEDLAETLITLGGLFPLGLVTDLLGRRTALPRVTLLLIFGFLIGPSVFDLLPEPSKAWFPGVTHMALVMVGFLLGGKLSFSSFRQHGRLVLWISIAVVVATAALMLAGLLLLGFRVEVALLLAGIATSTAPAATADVVHEAKANGRFADTLLRIVAVDDAWGLMVFSIMLAVALALTGQGGGEDVLVSTMWDLGGAFVVGVALGVPMAYLTGRIQPGEPTLAEALGVVLLCGGIALWLDVSFLLASMVLGAAVANLARHHKRPFHAIEGIEWPFLILFFVLAGASLQIDSLAAVGLLGAAYLILRIVGRLLGAWAGGVLSNADPLMRRWMGVALMPQAGVALGMALVATQRLPELSDMILPVVIGATVLFEVIGPVLTRRALILAGEVPNPSSQP
ncbi:MAG: cation:proton antiporter [Acidiferrobacterales bacterium]